MEKEFRAGRPFHGFRGLAQIRIAELSLRNSIAQKVALNYTRYRPQSVVVYAALLLHFIVIRPRSNLFAELTRLGNSISFGQYFNYVSRVSK